MLDSGEAHISRIMGCLTERQPVRPLFGHARRHPGPPERRKPTVHVAGPQASHLRSDTGRNRSGTEDAFGRLMTATLMGPGAIISHCLTDEEFEELDHPLKPGLKERNLNACLVEQAGGIEPFIRWLTENDPAAATEPAGYDQCAGQDTTP